MNIKEILEKVANGEEVTIDPSELSPEDMKILGVGMGGTAMSTMDKVENAFTGDFTSMPYEDLRIGPIIQPQMEAYVADLKKKYPPNAAGLPPMVPPEMMATGPRELEMGYHSAVDTEGKLNILKKIDPNLAKSAKTDPWGNTYVTLDGKRKYINRPGASWEDFSEVLQQTLNTAPYAALAALAGPGTLLGRMLFGGAAAGAGSIQNDLVAKAAGSGQNPSLSRAGVNAAAGVIGEGLAVPIGKAGAAIWKAFKTPTMVRPDGRLSAAGERLLSEAGIDWEGLSEQAKKSIQLRVQQAKNPVEALHALAAEDLPGGPIRLTEGQLKGDMGLYNDEKLLRTGAFGDPATDTMRNFDRLQAGDIRNNVDAISGKINPAGGRQTSWGEGGAAGAEALRKQELEKVREAAKAFDIAKDPSNNAFVPDITELSNKIANDADLQALARTNPGLKQALDEFNTRFGKVGSPETKVPGSDVLESINKKLAEKGRPEIPFEATTDTGGSSASVPELFRYMQFLNKSAGQAGAAGQPIRELRRTISNYLQDDAVMQLIQGNTASVKNWIGANKLWKEYKDIFDADDIISKLTRRVDMNDPKKPEWALNVEDASKVIFGAQELGMINRQGAIESFRKLKKMLPEQEWNSLREETFLRMTGWGPEDFASPDKFVPSAAKLRTNLANFEKKNLPLMRVIFSKEELATIKNFTNTYAKATLSPEGAHKIGSDTAPLLMRAVQQLGKSFGGPKMKAMFDLTVGRLFVPAIERSVRATAAKRATGESLRGALPALFQLPLPVGVTLPLSIPGAKTFYDNIVKKYQSENPQ